MQWLRDAHGMEKQAEKMLSALSGRIESFPQLKKRPNGLKAVLSGGW
jgi:ferritin-like metal-binding protein YciE